MTNVINSGNFVNPGVSGDTQVRIVNGLKCGFIKEVVTPNGSASYDLTSKLPAGAVVVSSTLTLSATVVATTAVKIGLGRKESTADPDKYLLTSALTAGTYGGAKVTGVLASSSAVETLQVVACDTAGGAEGTLDSGGLITAHVVYMVAE